MPCRPKCHLQSPRVQKTSNDLFEMNTLDVRPGGAEDYRRLLGTVERYAPSANHLRRRESEAPVRAAIWVAVPAAYHGPGGCTLAGKTGGPLA